MKDPSKLISPNAIGDHRRAMIVKTVIENPDMTYAEIGKRFGLSNGTVGRIAQQHGIVRRKEKPKPNRRDRPPDHPHLREGGILANDEQMAARHGMTLKQWLASEGR